MSRWHREHPDYEETGAEPPDWRDWADRERKERREGDLRSPLRRPSEDESPELDELDEDEYPSEGW